LPEAKLLHTRQTMFISFLASTTREVRGLFQKLQPPKGGADWGPSGQGFLAFKAGAVLT